MYTVYYLFAMLWCSSSLYSAAASSVSVAMSDQQLAAQRLKEREKRVASRKAWQQTIQDELQAERAALQKTDALLHSSSISASMRATIYAYAQQRLWHETQECFEGSPGKLSDNGRYLTLLHPKELTVSVFDRKEKKYLQRLGLPVQPTCWDCSKDGRCVVLHYDAKAAPHNVEPGFYIYKAQNNGYTKHASMLSAHMTSHLVMSADGSVVAMVSNGAVYIWQSALSRLQVIYDKDGQASISVVMSADGERIACFYKKNPDLINDQHSIRVYDVLSGTCIKQFKLNSDTAHDEKSNQRMLDGASAVMALSGNGKKIAYNVNTACIASRAHKSYLPRTNVFEVDTGALLATVPHYSLEGRDYKVLFGEHEEPTKNFFTYNRLQLSHEGDFIALTLFDGRVELHDTIKGGLVSGMFGTSLKQSIQTNPKRGLIYPTYALMASDSHELVLSKPSQDTPYRLCVYSWGMPCAYESLIRKDRYSKKRAATILDCLTTILPSDAHSPVRELISSYLSSSLSAYCHSSSHAVAGTGDSSMPTR